MIVGVDMGASAVKLCGLEGDKVLFTHYENGRGGDISALLERLDVDASKASAIALTGLSANCSGLEVRGLPLRYVPEPNAIGAGAVWLTGRDNAVVASIGTGTAFVLAREGRYTHLCGSGVGGGTLKGLSVRVLGMSDMSAFDDLAIKGSAEAVDLLIGDFVESYGTLDPKMTASNLARLNDSATDADWAAGLTNLILQSLGTMSLLACRGSGADCIIVTGAMAGSAPSRKNFKSFTEMYGVPYIIPPYCECATAIGTARLAL
ncbi:MAG: hypothetical protein EOM54_01285 [Clostridia bacterium]|nr:hypothetical protein [Clostridia bacterium]